MERGGGRCRRGVAIVGQALHGPTSGNSQLGGLSWFGNGGSRSPTSQCAGVRDLFFHKRCWYHTRFEHNLGPSLSPSPVSRVGMASCLMILNALSQVKDIGCTRSGLVQVPNNQGILSLSRVGGCSHNPGTSKSRNWEVEINAVEVTKKKWDVSQ